MLLCSDHLQLYGQRNPGGFRFTEALQRRLALEAAEPGDRVQLDRIRGDTGLAVLEAEEGDSAKSPVVSMQFVLNWDSDGPEDLLISTSGQATPDDLHAMASAAVADPRFRQGMSVLVDHSKTVFSTMSPSDVRRRADMLRAHSHAIGRQRVAFVMRDKSDYGIMRQLQGLTDGYLPFQSEAFNDVEAARVWLRTSGSRR